MKKMHYLPLLLAVLLCAALLAVPALAAPADAPAADAPASTVVDSGTCGDNLTWTLDSDGLLTISGTGKMYNYEASYGDSKRPFKTISTEIKNVVINEGVTSIGCYAFYNCSKLESVTISSGVTTIGDGAFYNCSKLESVTIPSSVTSIWGSAFYNCSSLKSIEIPSGVTTIGSRAFYDCSSLESVTIPSSVTTIGSSAFSGCSSLESVTIPSGVTTIESGAFYKCSSLKSIEIPSGVTSIGYGAFWGCSSLESVAIPSGVTDIEQYVFASCSSLKSVVFPSGVHTIAGNAFGWCDSLKSVVMPSSVTSIWTYAFYRCNRLTDVYFTGSKAEWDAGLGKKPEAFEYPVTVHYNYAPSAPTISVALDKATGKPCISWTADTPAVYSILREDGTGSFTVIGTTAATSWIDWTAVAGTIYSYKVMATAGDKTALSDVQTGFAACVQPEMSSLTVRAWDGRPVLNWGAVDGASSYEIYRFTNGGTFYKQKTVTATTYVDTSAQAGNTYSYQIRALAATGSAADSGRSEAVSIVAACARPTVTGAQSSDGQPTLSWSAVSGADKYQVYRSINKGSGYKLAATVTATSYTDTTAVNGGIYYYKVHAVSSKSAASRSSASSVVEVGCGEALAQPVLSGSVRAWDGKPGLKWAKVDGADSYRVYRSTSKNSGYELVGSGVAMAGDMMAYADATAVPGTTYYYKVHAATATSLSTAAGPMQITADCARPTVSIRLDRGGLPQLSWDEVENADRFQIWRSTKYGSGYTVVEPAATGLKWADTAAEDGVTYYYKVRAYSSANTNSYSATSFIKSIKTELQPTKDVNTLIQYIKANGETAGSDKMIERETTGTTNGTDYTTCSRIDDWSQAGEIYFRFDCELGSGIKLSADFFYYLDSTPRCTIRANYSNSNGAYFSTDFVTLDMAQYTTDTVLHFTISATNSTGDFTSIANAIVQMALATWEEHLNTVVDMSLYDLGFILL